MIPDLLDEPQNEVTRLQYECGGSPRTMWESRIALNGINISYSKDGVTAELVGIITETMQTAGIHVRSGSNGNS